jgi:adenylate cyclase
MGSTADRLAPVREAWRRLRAVPQVRRLRALASRLAAVGTAGYPPDVRRRLKILNLIAYLIAVTTFVNAVNQAAIDYQKYEPVVLLNAGLVVMAVLLPLAHRINDVAAGIILVLAEYAALLGFSAFFGREGGAHLQYIIAAAAPFVVFGLARLRLVAVIVLMGLVLHIYAWFAFEQHNAVMDHDHAVLDPIYIQAAVTTFGLIAASVYYAFSLVEQAKAETDALLRNILPDSIVERLQENPAEAVADSYEQASILFADISGFVALSRRLGAPRTVELLSRLVTRFDALAERHGVEKIKTIGDAYMAAAGVPERCPDHAQRLARMAIDMLTAMRALAAETGERLELRIGMAAGPVMAGVIGRRKFSYDVWGDAVNLAARLESAGVAGRIHICPTCRALLDGTFVCESRGILDIKGLGPSETWFLLGERDSVPGVASPSSAAPSPA